MVRMINFLKKKSTWRFLFLRGVIRSIGVSQNDVAVEARVTNVDPRELYAYHTHSRTCRRSSTHLFTPAQAYIGKHGQRESSVF